MPPPNARPVETPAGRFNSAHAAARYHGLTPSEASHKARMQHEGWKYVSDAPSPSTYRPWRPGLWETPPPLPVPEPLKPKASGKGRAADGRS